MRFMCQEGWTQSWEGMEKWYREEQAASRRCIVKLSATVGTWTLFPQEKLSPSVKWAHPMSEGAGVLIHQAPPVIGQELFLVGVNSTALAPAAFIYGAAFHSGRRLPTQSMQVPIVAFGWTTQK